METLSAIYENTELTNSEKKTGQLHLKRNSSTTKK